VVIVFSGLRYGIGIDYSSYWLIFNTIENSHTEPGFRILNIFLKIFFGPQSIFLFTSLVFILLVNKSINFFLDRYQTIALFLLLFSGFLIESFNILRQYFAIAIFFYSVRFIYAEQRKKYFFSVLIAASIHVSAILLLPFYWILKVKYNRYFLFLCIALSLCFSYIFPLKLILERIPYYGNYLSLYRLSNPAGDLGVGFISQFFIVCVLIYYYEYLITDTKRRISFNCFVFYIVFMSLFKDYMVFLRFAYYFHIFVIVLIPLLLSLFTERSRFVIYIGIVVYALLLFYVTTSSPSSYIIPYSFNVDFFTNQSPIR
jgi:hypothetical protein